MKFGVRRRKEKRAGAAEAVVETLLAVRAVVRARRRKRKAKAKVAAK
jgi:hypothetical protein